MDTNSSNEKKPKRPRIGASAGASSESRFEKVTYGERSTTPRDEHNQNYGSDAEHISQGPISHASKTDTSRAITRTARADISRVTIIRATATTTTETTAEDTSRATITATPSLTMP